MINVYMEYKTHREYIKYKTHLGEYIPVKLGNLHDVSKGDPIPT